MNELVFKIWRMLPDSVRVPMDILRRCPRWKAAGVIFIHVPKAAGVSVSRAIYGRTLGHFYAQDIKKVCPRIFESLHVFAVVRHPVDRLFSAYRFAKKGGTDVMGMKDSLYYVNHPSFTSFEKFVTEWLVHQNLKKVDGVFRPQYLYLYDESESLIVDSVYKLEYIDEGIKHLSSTLNRDFTIEHYNKSEDGQLNISNELADLIYKLYRKDFELLSYDFEEFQ
jgi:hypothetical protein